MKHVREFIHFAVHAFPMFPFEPDNRISAWQHHDNHDGTNRQDKRPHFLQCQPLVYA